MTRYPTKTHYSPHFTRVELECKCGCVAPRHIRKRLRRLAKRLERMSRHVARLEGSKKGRVPIGVLSGYRCPAQNRRVHGAVMSQHLHGRAADLVIPRGKQTLYYRAAEKVRQFRNGGIGIYPNGGLHVDGRGWRARWSSYVGQ